MIDHEQQEFCSPRLIIVMGVSGSGKSTVAKKLAGRLGMVFMEADSFHSKEAKDHMASGKALTDDMREPWIIRMLKFLDGKYKRNKSVVLAYSGLKRAHRERFRSLPYQPNILFVFLEGDKRLIAARMNKRKKHFMSATLLDSQFEAMEPPQKESDIVIFKVDSRLNHLVSNVQTTINNYFS